MRRCKWRSAALLILFSTNVWNQSVSGSITGAVIDPSGAGVPSAGVTVTNPATGVRLSMTTNAQGYYLASNLIAGDYQVEVTATGFKTFRQNSVPVTIGSTVRLDVQLDIGSLQDAVNVEETASLVTDDKVNLGGTISSKEMEALPTLGRNPTALAKLQPGVIEGPNQQGLPSAGGTGQFSFSANGQRAQLNYFFLDGVDNTEGVGGGASIVPSVEAMQEFTVSTTNYDVEFGQVAGAVAMMTTRSGTNQIHGSANWDNRVNALFARNSFTEPNGPGHFVFNQFGGTLGGPIKKNKLFLFGHYQGVQVRSGGNILATVPVERFRRGDFSSLPNNPIFDPATGGAGGVGRTQFPGNIIPANRINSVSRNLLALIPLPNNGTGTDLNFLAPNTVPTNQNLGTIRGDYVLNDSNRFFVRYTRTVQDQTSSVPAYGTAVWPNGNVANGNNNSLSFDYTKVFRPNLLFEGRFGWLQREWSQDAVDQASNTSTDIGLPGVNDACPVCGGLTGFRIGGPVGAFDVGNNDHAHQVDNYGGYNYVGIVTWTKGAHNIKFGGDINFTWRDRRDTSSQGNIGCFNSGLCDANGFAQALTGSPAVQGSGLSTASFLLGGASAFSRVIYARNLPEAKQQRQAYYFQDTWRVTRKLTLNLGLRYDFIGYPTSPQPGGIANFNFSNAYTIVSNYGDTTATANVDNNFTDFGPRLGVAYRLHEKTVIRAGFARTFSIGFFGANFGAITNDWPNATRQKLVQNDPYTPAMILTTGPPRFVSGFEILEAAGNPGQYPTPLDSTGFGMDRNNPTHSVDQWNFAIQHQFRSDVSVTVAYVGNAGRHMFYRRDYNAAFPGAGTFASRKRFGSIGYLVNAYNQSNQTSSGYHGLQVQGEKRYSQGLILNAALTWGKSYDFGSHNAFNPWDHNADRALQDGDRALVLAVGHVWELPFGPNKKYLKSDGPIRFLTAGWQFSGITRWMSGTPFTPTVANTASLNSDCCTLRPDRLGQGTVANPDRNQWFDRTAFAVPGLYQFGNSGRNILRGPSFGTADWALSKSLRFTETFRLELRWEAFNAFNQTNLGNPTSAIDSSLAGRITGLAHFMRRQQLGAHFYW